MEPDQGQRGAEPVALLGRVDTDDVDLADRRVVVVLGAVEHGPVDLGPVEADQI